MSKYPEEEDLYLIEKHTIHNREDCVHLAEIAEDLWNSKYGRVEWDGDVFACEKIRFITGGWSGNEDIIDALGRNEMWWDACWESTHRGGLYVFSLPEEDFDA